MSEIAKNLRVMFPNDLKRKQIISLCALTFQLSVESLEELLGIDKEILYNNLAVANGNLGSHIDFIFKHYCEIQDVAKEKFIKFYERLLRAFRYRNKKLFIAILSEIDDSQFVNFKNNHKLGSSYTDEEILMIVKYQIKYSLTMQSLLNTFHISKKVYTARLKEILPNYPDLQTKFEFLMDFYRKSSKDKWQRS